MSRECITGLLTIVVLLAAMRASAQADVEKRLDDLERRVKALETVHQQTQVTPLTRPTNPEWRYGAPLAWTDKIRAKIRGNIILPQDIAGNPEAVFDVTLLPTGEVLTVRKTKSSGNPGYDDAVERAILKSSPLPQPDDRSVFQRQLQLAFRPQDR
jgi:colicin import membrane protein